jgi:transposase
MSKKYDEKFKNDALEYRKNHPELSVSAVCRNLGISQPTYYQWKKSADENDGQVKHIGSGNYANDQEKEIAELRRELKNSQDALKILKKAMGILAKEEQ